MNADTIATLATTLATQITEAATQATTASSVSVSSTTVSSNTISPTTAATAELTTTISPTTANKTITNTTGEPTAQETPNKPASFTPKIVGGALGAAAVLIAGAAALAKRRRNQTGSYGIASFDFSNIANSENDQNPGTHTTINIDNFSTSNLENLDSFQSNSRTNPATPPPMPSFRGALPSTVTRVIVSPMSSTNPTSAHLPETPPTAQAASPSSNRVVRDDTIPPLTRMQTERTQTHPAPRINQPQAHLPQTAPVVAAASKKTSRNKVAPEKEMPGRTSLTVMQTTQTPPPPTVNKWTEGSGEVIQRIVVTPAQATQAAAQLPSDEEIREAIEALEILAKKISDLKTITRYLNTRHKTDTLLDAAQKILGGTPRPPQALSQQRIEEDLKDVANAIFEHSARDIQALKKVINSGLIKEDENLTAKEVFTLLAVQMQSLQATINSSIHDENEGAFANAFRALDNSAINIGSLQRIIATNTIVRTEGREEQVVEDVRTLHLAIAPAKGGIRRETPLSTARGHRAMAAAPTETPHPDDGAMAATPTRRYGRTATVHPEMQPAQQQRPPQKFSATPLGKERPNTPTI